MKGFRNLMVWRKDHVLTLANLPRYREVPKDEGPGLNHIKCEGAQSQIAAKPALNMATGSASELE
jgi:hypothetical protein